MVYRIYVEKKPGLENEARGLFNDIRMQFLLFLQTAQIFGNCHTGFFVQTGHHGKFVLGGEFFQRGKHGELLHGIKGKAAIFFAQARNFRILPRSLGNAHVQFHFVLHALRLIFRLKRTDHIGSCHWASPFP